jgi:NAD+ kinase
VKRGNADLESLRANVFVVAKETSYARYVERMQDARTKKLLATGDASVAGQVETHRAHLRTLEVVNDALGELGITATQVPFPSRIPASASLVITVGGDGTLLGSSHDVGEATPILGINSAPKTSIGFFCAGSAESARRLLRQTFLQGPNVRMLARMQVTLDDKVLSQRVLNEALFCHSSPAATSRYELRIVETAAERAKTRQQETGKQESQRSSGLWIGPPAGSTAAQRSAGGRVLRMDREVLQYVVREAYAPHGKKPKLTRGIVGKDGSIELLSRMRSGRIFLDGPDLTFAIELGARLRFAISSDKLSLVHAAHA